MPPSGSDEVEDFVATEIAPWITSLREPFWRGLDRTDTLRDSLVRYVLVEIERYIRKEARIRAQITTDRTVEHIFPQQANQSNISEYFGPGSELCLDPQEALKRVIYSLGNLGLLTTNETVSPIDICTRRRGLTPIPQQTFA